MCTWTRLGETGGEVQSADDDDDDDGARGRRMITLKLQCPNFLKAGQNQILLDKNGIEECSRKKGI